MAHINDSPGCPCYDCRQLRFQCWRMAVESGCAVLWQDGHWSLAPDDADEYWDEERAA